MFQDNRIWTQPLHFRPSADCRGNSKYTETSALIIDNFLAGFFYSLQYHNSISHPPPSSSIFLISFSLAIMSGLFRSWPRTRASTSAGKSLGARSELLLKKLLSKAQAGHPLSLTNIVSVAQTVGFTEDEVRVCKFLGRSQ